MLELLDAPVADELAGARAGHDDRAEDLAALERGLVRPGGELGDRDLALGRHRDGVEGEQQGRRVRVRLGEAEVAAERAGGADARVGDPALESRQGRERLPDERRPGDVAVRRERADLDPTGGLDDPVEVGDRLEVDQDVVASAPCFIASSSSDPPA